MTGRVGLFWFITRWAFYRAPEEHPADSAAELAHIRRDQEEQAPPPMPSRELLRHCATRAYAAVPHLSSPV